jgi:hypothetical protein
MYVLEFVIVQANYKVTRANSATNMSVIVKSNYMSVIVKSNKQLCSSNRIFAFLAVMSYVYIGSFELVFSQYILLSCFPLNVFLTNTNAPHCFTRLEPANLLTK